MNNNLKPTLWAILAALVMMMWLKWEAANAPKMPVAEITTSPISQDANTNIPGKTPQNKDISDGDVLAESKGRLIHIKTDVLDLTIDTVGGTIVDSQLLKYTKSLDDKTPVKIFSSEQGEMFYFQTGLNDASRKKNPTHSAIFTSPQENFDLSGDILSVPLTWEADGVKVTKTFTFKRGQYDFKIEQKVDNNSDRTWSGYQYSRLKSDEVSVPRGLTTFNTFAGGVYSVPDDKYKKRAYDVFPTNDNDSERNNRNKEELKSPEGGWVGMMRHYFMGAIIPQQNDALSIMYQRQHNGKYVFDVYTNAKQVESGNSITFKSTGFVGPKIKDDLARIAPNLDKATDYGWLFFISEYLFNVLDWVHSVVKNWGWAIVIVTISIKALLFPLAAKSFKSMAKMRKFQPEMERIRENYKEDRQLQGKKTMELYKKEGINPAAGCLPILVQIPIFLAFYYMLMESVELRQAPWIFWIKDLAVKDPFFVLPVINMCLMFLQQRLNPPPSDPMQRKVMMFLPLIFGLMFLVFPAGLVLYWAVSNSFSIIQQYVVTKRYGGLANPLSHADDKHYHPKE